MWKIIIKIVNLKVVIMLEYKNRHIFAKGYTPNCSEEVVVKVPWTYVIEDVYGKETIGRFTKKNYRV